MKTILLTVFSLLLAASTVSAIAQRRLIDMTYPFAADTLHWPTAQPFNLETVNEGRTPQGFWYSSYNYSGSEHVGTHLDAPFHFAEGKWTTEQIPLTKLIGSGVVIDVRNKAGQDRDYLLRPDDVRTWEKRHGRIPKDAIVLMYTGWGRYWGDRKRYFGTDEPGNVTDLHFPGFSKEAAEFLIKQRNVAAVGIDTPSIDHGPSKDFTAHQVFCGANIPIFENVASLDQVPPKGATIFALPMKIKGGSGGPLRIFALIP
jgi:kynurenine formamidase